MKKMFVLSMLISLAMICSCQKQDSAAEQQLAQRKTELDAREKVLDERENALAEKEKAMTNPRTIPSGIQGQTPDPEQAKAEKRQQITTASPRASDPDSPHLEGNSWRPGKTSATRPTTAWAGRLTAPMAA
jgi:hypothetical protein